MTDKDAMEPRVKFVEITDNEQKGKNASVLVCCPFHFEKTPSCIVNYERMVFHCLSCGALGSVENGGYENVRVIKLTEEGILEAPKYLDDLVLKKYGLKAIVEKTGVRPNAT